MERGEVRWGKVIDQERCIGCHACTVACKAEHEVPLGVTRTFVKQVEAGRYPNVSRHFQVTRCNQCEDPPCVHVCPVTALFIRPDGIVDFDREVCIGCRACMAACPYDALYIDPESLVAEKCNFCAHRIDRGLEPACVAVCPEEAILVGNILDADSQVSRILARQKVEVRRPEKGTRPKLWYVGDTTFARDPGGAAPSPGGGFWMGPGAAPGGGHGQRPASARSAATSMAAAMVAYDVPHASPWGWYVSAYTWTKSLAAGAFLVPALLSLGGLAITALWLQVASAVALVFLAATGALLVADLTKPLRFLRVLTRPQWRSWLARGSYCISAYGIALLLALAAPAPLRIPGIVLAVLTAVYTAFLFAQCRGRDLWQNPLLPLHLIAQAVVAGGAATVLLGLALPLPAAAAAAAAAALGWGLVAHLALAVSEWLVPHPTADGARAFAEMTSGRLAGFHRGGLILGLIAAVLAWLGPLAAAVAAVVGLVGLYLYEHAYVQGGQSAPLA